MNDVRPMRRSSCFVLIAIPLAIFVAVGVVSGIVTSSMRADWEARSGSVTVRVDGVLETDGWLITGADLETNAEYETSSLALSIERKAVQGIGNLPINRPGVRATVGGVTCERLHARGTSGTLGIPCDRYFPLDEVGDIGSVTIVWME